MSQPAVQTKPLLNRGWNRLDNAGTVYPAMSTQKWSSLFRIAAIMKQDINPELLQQAADRVLPRFPTINAQLKAGFYWYYLTENPQRLLVEPDIKFPCSPIHWRRKNAHLLKIFYGEKRIAIDFFHAVTDGTGALIFLKTLVAEYLRLSGVNVPAELGVLDLESLPTADEMTDAFVKLPLPKSKGIKGLGRAFRFPVQMSIHMNKHIHTYITNVGELKNKAAQFGVTINEYLTAAFIYIGVEEQLKHNPKKLRPIRVSVPVNMRRFYETKTLRNFSSVVNPEIRPPFNDVSFEHICFLVRDYMKNALTAAHLYETIAPNVALEKNFFSRLTPLFIKNLLILTGYKIMSSKATTTTLTNLGVFTAPTALMNELETIEVILGPARHSGVGATVLTTGENVRITFTSTQVHPALAEELERLLNGHGLKTKMEVISE